MKTKQSEIETISFSTNDTGSVSNSVHNDVHNKTVDSRGGEWRNRLLSLTPHGERSRRSIRKYKNADREAAAVMTFRTHGLSVDYNGRSSFSGTRARLREIDCSRSEVQVPR